MAVISLLVVHPSTVFRLGIEAMLKGSRIRVIGQASSGGEALKAASQQRPHVVLMSDQLADGDVFDHARSIREALPDTHVLLMGASPNPTIMARAAAAGVADFVSDITSAKDLKDAISAAAAGHPLSDSSPYGTIVSSLKNRSPETGVDLTPREQQVLRHIAYGLSNEEIAYSMQISIETVKEFVSGILRKLHVKDRTQAAVWAVRRRMT